MKTNRSMVRIVAALSATALGACGGGGGGSSHVAPTVATAPAAQTATAPPGTSAAFKIVLPNATGRASGASSRTAAGSRTPKFVSGGINAIRVVAGPDSGYPTGSSSTVFDVSRATGTGSGKTCSDNGDGTRTCTLYIAAPPGPAIDFFFATYDQVTPGTPPTLPATANVLSVGKSTGNAIVAGTANGVNVTLLGVALGFYASLGAFTATPQTDPMIVSVAGNAPYTAPLFISGEDASGSVVNQGTFAYWNYNTGDSFGATDLIADPMVLYYSQEGSTDGGVHTTLNLSGGSCPGSFAPSSANVPYPRGFTSAAQFCYDGTASPGYFAEIQANWLATNLQLVITPLFVVASATALSGPGTTVTLAAHEVSFYGTKSYTATPEGGCSGIAVNPPSLAATSSGNTDVEGDFTVTQTGTQASCTIDVSDGTATVPVVFTGGSTSVTITIPSAHNRTR